MSPYTEEGFRYNYDTVTYTYGDSDWGDLLTSYDGQALTYDAIGNPLSDGTWTYTWEHGRELASMSRGGTTWNFTYNADGLRTQRTNGGTTYTYVYNGDKLSQMIRGEDTLNFTYDASGTPVTVVFNGTTYYYVTNIQGDVIAILDSAGKRVTTYVYDAWGRSLFGVVGELGTLNPLRYRGYVYDDETGLYYLQSRYYDPEIGRFINADAYISTGQGFIGNNMFAYCGNNPVNNIDPSGTCYYNASGQWCHDNWEYIGGYPRKPDPGYYQGTTPTGLDVYVATDDNYATPPNAVKVVDKRDTNTYNGERDPDFQIRDSYKITKRADQVGIITILYAYDAKNPSLYEWDRTQHSLIIEWIAHNHINFLYSNDRCQHVDFNTRHEGVSYIGFWYIACQEGIKEVWSWLT